MTSRLVILGFLRGRPQYGYEIKQMIERVMGDWENIAFGSIYFALKKLSDEGFVERVGAEQKGKRPSRMVYRITDAGRVEFMRLLREVWENVERQTFSFDIGLSLMSALPIEEAKDFLKKRVTQLEHILSFLDSHQTEQLADKNVPRAFASAIFGHHRSHLQTELDWTKGILQEVESGEFDAELEWMRGLFDGKTPEGASR